MEMEEREKGPETLQSASSSRLPIILALVLLLLFVAQGASFVIGKSATYDEGAHIAAGLSAWRTGDFKIFDVNPPLVRMIATLPLLAMNVPLPLEKGWEMGYGIGMINEIASAYHKPFHNIVMACRWPILAMTALLMALVWRDARKHLGEPAALTAAALFATQPMLIAHGSIATVDAGAVLFMYLAVRTFLEYSRRGWNVPRALLMGLALGAALAAKFTNLSLLVSLPLISVALFQKRNGQKTGLLKRAGLTAAALLVALIVLNACYGFEGTFHRIDSYEFKSRLLSTVSRLLPDATPVPLPSHLVSGFERQSVFNEEHGGSHALTLRDGEWIKGRRPFMFFYYAATKLTIPLLAAFLASLPLMALRIKRRAGGTGEVWPAAFLIVILLHFALIAFVAQNYHSFRYILGIVPFMVFLGGFAVGELGSMAQPRWKADIVLPSIVIASSLFISAMAYPDYLAYGNAFMGGEERALRNDPDFCRDWGQDLIGLKKWRDENPSGKLYLAYSGSIDPVHYGLTFEIPPDHPEPGVWAVSSGMLRGKEHIYTFQRDNRNWTIKSKGVYFGWLEGLTPDDKVGQFYIYRIGQEPASP